jgi:hypothetical protein
MATGNPLLSTLRGRIGDITFRQRKGTQVSAKRQPVVSNPRSYSQMNVRTQLSNLCAFYRVLEGFWPRAFEDKKQKQTEFNAFTSANLNSDVRVYLTKEQAAANVCYLAAYKISSGTLPSITYGPAAVGSSYLITNIQLPADFDMSAATTVAQLSQAIVDNNNAWELNDQLSFVSMTQDGTTATANLYEITLDLDNTDSYVDYLPEGVFEALKYESDGKTYLAFIGNDGSALVHSRWLKNKGLKVSDQRLYVISPKYKQADNATHALNAAISYGGSADAFLSSGSEANAINDRDPYVDNIYYVDAAGNRTQLSDYPNVLDFAKGGGSIVIEGVGLTTYNWDKLRISFNELFKVGDVYDCNSINMFNYLSDDIPSTLAINVSDTAVVITPTKASTELIDNGVRCTVTFINVTDGTMFDGAARKTYGNDVSITGVYITKDGTKKAITYTEDIAAKLKDGYKLCFTGNNLTDNDTVAVYGAMITSGGTQINWSTQTVAPTQSKVFEIDSVDDNVLTLSYVGGLGDGDQLVARNVRVLGAFFFGKSFAQ